MTYAFALTIPGLAVGLVLLGVADLLLFRRSGRRLLRGSPQRVAPTAYDEAAAFFSPGKRHELEERHTAALVVDGVPQGAPGSTTVDLTAGTARVTRSERTDT